jgi:C1A family cysteine protease
LEFTTKKYKNISGSKYFMVSKLKGMGWLRDPIDPRDFSLENRKVKKILTKNNTKKLKEKPPSDLPNKIDNRKWCPLIEDQGHLGSCTANAGVGMYEYMQNKATRSYIDGSRLFLYKATRLLMGREGVGDSGAYIRTTLGAIRLFGIPQEDYWPYTDDPVEFDKMPDPWLWSLGQYFKSLVHFRLDYSLDADENIKRIKEFVSYGFAVDFGFYVFHSIWDSNHNGGIIPFPSNTERYEGGHSVLIVGYDDDKVSINDRDGNTATGCFLIRNSWGEDWGDYGYGWIPYQFFRPKFNGDVLADDAWTITSESWIDTGEFMP